LLESALGQKQQIKEIASDNAPSARCETSVCRGPSAKLKTPDFHLRVTLAISAVSVPAASEELLIFHFHESARGGGGSGKSSSVKEPKIYERLRQVKSF
jgi:hypothetical protein